jgi:uncharacterized phiE125 gp8 family phage protein
VRYSLVTVTPPVSEPVSLAVAKAHLRIDHDEENENIRGWIGAARELCEAYTGRVWGERTLRLTLPGFPYGPIELPVMPVSEVTLLTYLDSAGDLTTVLEADYQTWLDHNPPLVSALPDEAWGQTETGRLNAVTVEFTAGAGEVPEMARAAILLTLGMWDENRGDQNALIAKGLPPGAKRLLDLLDTGAYLR